jgi:hypothetical protein
MKKALSILLILSLCVAVFAGCGGKTGGTAEVTTPTNYFTGNVFDAGNSNISQIISANKFAGDKPVKITAELAFSDAEDLFGLGGFAEMLPESLRNALFGSNGGADIQFNVVAVIDPSVNAQKYEISLGKSGSLIPVTDIIVGTDQDGVYDIFINTNTLWAFFKTAMSGQSEVVLPDYDTRRGDYLSVYYTLLGLLGNYEGVDTTQIKDVKEALKKLAEVGAQEAGAIDGLLNGDAIADVSKIADLLEKIAGEAGIVTVENGLRTYTVSNNNLGNILGAVENNKTGIVDEFWAIFEQIPGFEIEEGKTKEQLKQEAADEISKQKLETAINEMVAKAQIESYSAKFSFGVINNILFENILLSATSQNKQLLASVNIKAEITESGTIIVPAKDADLDYIVGLLQQSGLI